MLVNARLVFVSLKARTVHPRAMAAQGAEAAVGKPPRVFGPVAAATALAFLIEVLIDPPRDLLNLVGRLVGLPIVALFAFLFGRWLGTRTWPKRGRRVARYMLKRAATDRAAHVLFISDRPDVKPRLAQRTFEIVGFSAGTAVIVTTILALAGFQAAGVAAFASTFTLVTLWLSFVLVPYWMFARMGLRQVDAVRWLVLPLSRRYADRLRLSNGALLLIAFGATINLAFRAGASGDEALISGLVTVARLVASILIAAATGAAYYARQEHALARELEAEALELGIRDGRGMTDGDFLPRLPPPQARAPAPALMEHHLLRPAEGAATGKDELDARQ